MAQLRGQAALEWIKANPGRAYNVVSGQLPQEAMRTTPQRSLIGNIIEGTGVPGLIRQGLETGREAVHTAFVDDTGLSYKPLFMKDDEYAKWKKNPLLEGAKTAGKIGSMAIGGSVPKAALGGAVYGASNTENIRDLPGNIATGGLVGGGSQALISKVIGPLLGKAGNKMTQGSPNLKEAGTKTLQNSLGLKNPKTPQGYQQAMNLTDDFANILEAKGQPLNPKGMSKAFSMYSDDLTNILDNAPDQFKVSDIVDDVFANSSVFNPNTNKQIVTSQVRRVLADAGIDTSSTVITAKQLAQIKRKLQPIQQKIERSAKGGTFTSEDANKYQTIAGIYNAIDPRVKAIPGAQPIYESMAKLYEAAPDVIEKAAKAGSVTLWPVSGIRVPTGNIPQTLQTKLGQGMRSMGQGIGGVITNAPNIPGGQVIGNTARNAVVGSQLPGMMPEQSGIEDTTQDFNKNTDTQGIAQIRDLLAVQMIQSGDYSPKEAMDTADLLIRSQTGIDLNQEKQKMTEKDKLFASAGASAQDALNLLEGGQAQTGKIANLGQGISGFIGTRSDSNTEYRALIADARTALQNAMLGANMSPREMEQLAAAIPRFSDEPKIAKQKLKTFIKNMDRRVNVGDATMQSSSMNTYEY